jgi:hypothetical protein
MAPGWAEPVAMKAIGNMISEVAEWSCTTVVGGLGGPLMAVVVAVVVLPRGKLCVLLLLFEIGLVGVVSACVAVPPAGPGPIGYWAPTGLDKSKHRPMAFGVIDWIFCGFMVFENGDSRAKFSESKRNLTGGTLLVGVPFGKLFLSGRSNSLSVIAMSW